MCLEMEHIDVTKVISNSIFVCFCTNIGMNQVECQRPHLFLKNYGLLITYQKARSIVRMFTSNATNIFFYSNRHTLIIP